MRPSARWGYVDQEGGVKGHAPRLLILDQSAAGTAAPPADSAAEILTSLEERGYDVMAFRSADEALEVMRAEHPDLVIVVGASDETPPGFRAAVQGLGIPVLDLIPPDAATHLVAKPAGLPAGADWFVLGGSSDELAARVARLVRRGGPGAGFPINAHLTCLIVHDLRSPLNVIGLSLRMLEPSLPRDDPEVREDLQFIDENFRQLERMLSQLGEYARLFEPTLELNPYEFDPERLVAELIETHPALAGGKAPPVRLEVEPSTPPEVRLDQPRARIAIEHVLTNAVAAAHNEPIRLTLRGAGSGSGGAGQGARWIIEVAVDRTPPNCVHSVELRPQSFERLCGTAAERRGMDLAIAARISELFGGTARFEAVPEQGTAIVLDWPARMDGAPAKT
jgi:signal transduction histidine kinase